MGVSCTLAYAIVPPVGALVVHSWVCCILFGVLGSPRYELFLTDVRGATLRAAEAYTPSPSSRSGIVASYRLLPPPPHGP